MKTRLLTALGFMTLVVFLRFGGTAVATPAAPYTPYGDNWLYFTNGNAIQSLAMEGSTLWVGTEGGVVRWDVTTGQYVKYTTADGLADNDVLAVAVDGAGSKWFGTGNGGVSRFDGVTWTTYTTADGLTSDFVLSIAIDSAGNKWFGTNYGVSKFDGTTWTTYTEADGLVYNMVRAIAIDSAGNKWFGTSLGLSKFDGTTWTTYTKADGLAANTVTSIAADGAGNLWFGTYGLPSGVSKFDGTTWTTYTTADGLAHNWVRSVAIDAAGNKWFGTSGGVSRFDDTTWTSYTTANGLPSNLVTANSIAIDGQGNPWVGTLFDGVSRFDGANWTTHATVNEPAHNTINDVAIDNTGQKWFATYGGVSRFDGMTWTTYTTADGLADDTVYAVAVDSANVKWFATADGVSRFDGTTWTTYTTADGLAKNTVWTMAIDSADVKWFGTNNGGVSRFDGSTWTTYTTADGLANNNVESIAIDGAGVKWFGTHESGVSRFDGTTWTTYTTADGLHNNTSWAIAVDSQDNKWFGGWGGGVSRFDGATWTTYTEGDGLASNYVQAIAIDRHGHKWFGTDWAGVSRFDGTTWTTYNIANGLIDNQVYAIAIDSQDNKWFGTVSGVGVLLAGDAPATYSISGRITDANGSPVAGVSVSAGGAGAATDGSGAYTLTGLITGTYTLTPAKTGWTFTPPSRTVGVPPDSTGQDFTAASASGLQLTGLEVTQGIQNLENDDVILIQDRPTFVRAHVQSGAGIINGVTAVLIGRRNGSDLPGSPLRPANVGGQIDVLAQPDRLQLDDSFYFELPAAWRSGTVELTFQGDSHTIACAEQAGTPGDCRVQVAFTDSPAADVRFVGIVWRAGGTLHQPAASDFDAVVQQINATLPIPDLAWDHPYDVEPVFLADAPTSGFDFARINLMLKVNRTLDGCVSLWPVNCTRYYLGVLIDPPADRLLNGMAGGIPADVASAYVLDGFTHPHELSHAIGRAHTDYNAQRGIAPPESGAQYHEPTAGTISQATAGDGAFYGFDIGARVVYGPETADLMSYGRPRWPSPWTYTHTRDHLVARYDARLAPLALLAGEPAVVVSGVVSPTAGAGSLTAVYAVDAPVSVAAPPPGAYAIRFEDGAGQALAVHSFAPDMVVEDRLAGAAVDEAIGTFTLLLPWPANAARIVLLHNGQPLAAQAASSGAPSVSVTYPNGGELLSGGTAVLSWTAVDPDGDPLTYAVQYSRDAGMSWQTLASTWPTTTYAFNLDAAAGSDQALLRVLASDGFHTAQDSSDATFTVATHPPRAVILGPAADSLYVGEQTILLNGRADDNEDGRLPGTALSWASSLDGALGMGESVALTAAALTEGTHAITLTAQDGDGQIGTASLTLRVSRDRPVLPAQLTVVPAAISFLAAEGAGQSAWQALSIRNAGDGALSWSAAADQSWIELQAPTGAAPGALAVAVNPAGLPIGTYSGTLTITANGAAGSPRVVEVVLHVREPYWLRLPIVVR